MNDSDGDDYMCDLVANPHCHDQEDCSAWIVQLICDAKINLKNIIADKWVIVLLMYLLLGLT
jgi:hypothetical protein